MGTASNWIDDIKSRGVIAVAAALDLNPRQRGSSADFACPGCRAETRHHKSRDRRGAVGVRPNGLGWRCHQCSIGGTAFDLACWSVGGGAWKSLSASQRDAVRAWCGAPIAMNLELVRAAPELPYPDVRDVMGLLRRCIPVTRDSEASAYLRAECIDPRLATESGLCGVLPYGTQLPGWGWFWLKPDFDNRMLFPLIDVDGQVRSVAARRMHDGDKPKSMGPKGHRRSGLVFACQPLRLHLRGKRASSATHLVFVEGEKKHALRSLAGDGALVVGVESGGLTPEFMERMPKSLERISILTDADTGGVKHANSIYNVMTTAQKRLDVDYTAAYEFGRLRNGTYGFSLLP